MCYFFFQFYYGSVISDDELKILTRLKEFPNDSQAKALLKEKFKSITFSENLYRILVAVPELTDLVLDPALYALVRGVIIRCLENGDTALVEKILPHVTLLKKEFLSSDPLSYVLTNYDIGTIAKYALSSMGAHFKLVSRETQDFLVDWLSGQDDFAH